ncbi:hypothetical protein PGB90_001845 [Kerria lacca]
MSGNVKNVSDSKSKSLSNEEQILNSFQTLREEQRQIATKLAEIDVEENELKVVISTLEKVDGSRKCYRLIGGILCEKTVKDVLPVLLEKKEELAKSHVKSKSELMKKGIEINEFKEKHNIRIQGQDENVFSSGNMESSNTSTSILS